MSERADAKKETPKQDESSSKQGKPIDTQKDRPKPIVEVTPIAPISNIEQDKKGLTQHVAAPQSKKEAPDTRTKQTRQNKKASNGTKSAEQSKGKEGKQKAASKKTSAKSTPKSPPPAKKSNPKQPQSASEFPPLMPASESPSTAMPKQANQKASVRPPPGLLAPPGFVDQPDLEGLSTPSSPSSPQRLSSHHSTTQYPMADGIPGMEIINSPPLNDDLFSLIGGSNRALESSLFQPPPDEGSPRAEGSESALSIPSFRPQSFTPPALETAATTETNSSEQAPDVQALLGAGSNFNVSNFLDGILGDATPQAPPRTEVMQQKPAEALESDPFQAMAMGLSLDPWNSNADDHTNNSDPLAALQGAANHRESPVIAGIPLNSNAPSLLATSTLQSNNSSIEYAEPAFASLISDDGGNEEDFLEPDSFYSQLLGED